ncbi:MAG: hypothetical protein ACREAM_25265, partial [Blastocatellia bacterium]
DDRGVYRVYGLAEGRYLVSVGFSQRDGEAPVQTDRAFYPRTFHPDTTDQAQAKVIEVTEGSENTSVDIAVGALKKAYDVFGSVINTDTGQPVAGISIFYGAVASDRRRVSGWGSKGEQTNAKGEFHLMGVLPGKHALFAHTDGASDFYGEVTICQVSDGDVEGVEIKVRQAGTISGVVAVEGANDPAALAKLKNIRLHFDSRSDQFSAPGGDSVPVNPDGSFRIRGLRPGQVELSLSQEAAALGLSRLRVERNGAPQPGASFEVGAGEHVTNVRFVVGYGTGAVRAQVKVVGGDWPEEFGLMVIARRQGDSLSSGQVGRVDARGQSLIEHLVPGEYELQPAAFSRSPNDQRLAQLNQSVSKVKERVVVGVSGEAWATLV